MVAMRRDCLPHLIDAGNVSSPLNRISFTDKSIAESFLQDIIHTSPTILPISKLDLRFSPPVSLGREISNIDNLLISPLGKITIVETKLWRNPEATREVIAQAIEYANKLWAITYEDLEAMARNALSPAPIKNKSLFEVVAEAYPDLILDEADFHDAVQDGLNHAEFLILIVGDGIRSNLESMVEMLYQPQMNFKFGLVEMQVYESATLPHRVVIPSLVAHSTELRRTIIKIEGGEKATVSINLEEPPSPPSKSRRVLTEEEFFEKIQAPEAILLFRDLLNFGKELGARPLWLASSVGLRVPDPNKIKKREFTLYYLCLDGTISDSYLGYQLNKVFGDISIATDRAQRLSELYAIPCASTSDSLERGIPWQQVAKSLDEFKTIMRETVNQIIQTSSIQI